MKNLTIFILAIFLSDSLYAFGLKKCLKEIEIENSKIYDKCIKSNKRVDGNTHHMRECSNQVTSAVDRKLNKQYKKIITYYKKKNPEFRSLFKSYQIAWVKFREKKCQSISGSGTASRLNESGCMQSSTINKYCELSLIKL